LKRLMLRIQAVQLTDPVNFYSGVKSTQGVRSSWERMSGSPGYCHGRSSLLDVE
jgi:hypothetical protein